MRSLLRALRHDVNYAIDLFSLLDQRATGSVTYQDFMAVFNERDSAFWHELALRLEHGGRLPGATPDETRAGGSTLFMPAGTYAEQQRIAHRRDRGGDGPGPGSPTGAGGGGGGAEESVDAVAADVLSSFGELGSTHRDAAAEAQSRLVPIPKVARPAVGSSGGSGGASGGGTADGRKGGGGESPDNKGDAEPSKGGDGAATAGGLSAAEQDEINKERARKVVSLLQSSIDRKKAEPKRSAVGQRVLSAIRQMRPRAGTPTQSHGAGSPNSANLAPPAPTGGTQPRSPASNTSGPASPATASLGGRSSRR